LDARRPAATLLFPARSITRLSRPRALVLGAIAGPIALLVIFALLSRSHIYFRNFAEISTLLAYTILVSTISFMVYLSLLREEMKSNPTRSQNFFHQA
jgi:predicted membrane protein